MAQLQPVVGQSVRRGGSRTRLQKWRGHLQRLCAEILLRGQGGAVGQHGGRRKGFFVIGLYVEDGLQSGGSEPGGRRDVGAALALEQQGEP